MASSLLQRDFLHLGINVLILVVVLYAFYRIARSRGVTGRLSTLLRGWLLNRYHIEPPVINELLNVAEGFGVVRVVPDDRSPVLGTPLRELDLKARKVQILSISREGRITTIPDGDAVPEAGDRVICYGSIPAIERSMRG